MLYRQNYWRSIPNPKTEETHYRKRNQERVSLRWLENRVEYEKRTAKIQGSEIARFNRADEELYKIWPDVADPKASPLPRTEEQLISK